MSDISFHGVLAFPVTPMDEQGTTVDLDAYQQLINWQVESGVHGVIPLGSTGEYPYLRADERRAIVDTTVKTIAGRVPAVVGVSALSTQDAVDHAHQANEASADAILLSVPTYYALTTAEVHQYVGEVATAAALPVVLYNNPYTSHVDITPDVLEGLLDIEEVVAVKEASMDVNRISTLHARFGSRLQILGGGFDPYALPAFAVGAVGWTTAMTNLTPARCVNLYETAVITHDLERARALHFELLPLANLLVELRLSVAVKAALRMMGRPVGAPRQPLLPLPADAEDRVRSALTSLGLVNGHPS